MGTLYIDRKDVHVKMDGNAIAVYTKDGRDGIVPVGPLKRVVILGSVTIETSVLNRLAREGASVLFLSGKRSQFCGMLHGRVHRNGILRVRQYEKSLSDNAGDIAYDLMKRKMKKQREFLMHIREQRADLRLELTSAARVIGEILTEITDNEKSMDSLRGYEGGASAQYFSAYTRIFPPSLEFKGRNKRPPKDPVNAVLSLCYTLMHYEMVREIEVAGMDPVIGFYHQFEYGRESLACDLIEPYRPDVDRFVWELFRDRTLTARDFSRNDKAPGCYLRKESRKRFYPVYEQWARQMRPEWTDEARGIARRVMDGQDIVY